MNTEVREFDEFFKTVKDENLLKLIIRIEKNYGNSDNKYDLKSLKFKDELIQFINKLNDRFKIYVIDTPTIVLNGKIEHSTRCIISSKSVSKQRHFSEGELTKYYREFAQSVESNEQKFLETFEDDAIKNIKKIGETIYINRIYIFSSIESERKGDIVGSVSDVGLMFDGIIK